MNEPEKDNPKNYPFWEDVVKLLRSKGYYVIQVGVSGELQIGANEVRYDLSLKDLKKLLDEVDTWASVDNFFNHFATYYKKRGVVVFGRSDPKIYGYPVNINLLKDKKFLRTDQFGLWESLDFKQDVFVEPYMVVSAIETIFV